MIDINILNLERFKEKEKYYVYSPLLSLYGSEDTADEAEQMFIDVFNKFNKFLRLESEELDCGIY